MPLSFDVADARRLEQFDPPLVAGYSLHDDGIHRANISFLDTFDWLLYQSGSILEAEIDTHGCRLSWRPLPDGTAPFRVQTVKATPQFAWDLPAVGLREPLRAVVGVRALLPVVRLVRRVRGWRLLDEEGKTVLRIELHRSRVLDQGGGSLPPRLVVFPVKGYDKAVRRVCKMLDERPGIERSREDGFFQALASAGRRPGDYSAKPLLHLDPSARTDEVAKQLLLQMLEVMQLNEDGIRRDVDAEFLHDYRVSVRRTRSLLTQVKRIFPAQRLERAKREFAWLGDITSPGRDMDVYLLDFDRFKARLPAEQREDLEPMRTFLRRHKEEAYDDLRAAMKSSRYRRLMQDWRKFLESPVPGRTTLPNAARPVRAVADERIWKVYRLAIREGRAIGPSSPPAELHELRKTCKKLRYLEEFFRSLYPAKEMGTLIKALKVLQDNLGEYQDLEVQQTKLHEFSAAMRREDHVPPETLAAVEHLVANFARLEREVRAEFDARFAAFSSKPIGKAYRRLFRSHAGASSQ